MYKQVSAYLYVYTFLIVNTSHANTHNGLILVGNINSALLIVVQNLLKTRQ